MLLHVVCVSLQTDQQQGSPRSRRLIGLGGVNVRAFLYIASRVCCCVRSHPVTRLAVHHACSLIATWMLFSIYSVSPSHICPWRSCIFLIKASSSVKMFLIISKSIKLQSLLFKLMDCCRIFQHWKNINKAVAEKIWYWNVVRLIFFFHKRTTHWLILFHSYVLPSFSVASALSVQRLALTLWSKKTFYC